MRHFLIYFFAIAIGVGATGCGRKLAPVTASEDVSSVNDSTTVSKNVSETDSSHVETVTEKTLPGATVEATFTKGQVDSMTNALKSLPPEVRVIKSQDPNLRAQLSFTLDSLGNLKIACDALQQKYFEKSIVEKTHRFEQAILVTNLRSEIRQLKNQVFELQKSPIERFKSFIDRFTMQICMTIAIALGLLLVVKSIRAGIGNKIEKIL